MECCTRNPVNTSSLPLSMATGMWTISSRLGYCRTFQSPSSRLSFCAAKLKRADCASQGLISCARETVFISSPNYEHFAAGRRSGLDQQANLQILVIGERGSKLEEEKMLVASVRCQKKNASKRVRSRRLGNLVTRQI